MHKTRRKHPGPASMSGQVRRGPRKPGGTQSSAHTEWAQPLQRLVFLQAVPTSHRKGTRQGVAGAGQWDYDISMALSLLLFHFPLPVPKNRHIVLSTACCGLCKETPEKKSGQARTSPSTATMGSQGHQEAMLSDTRELGACRDPCFSATPRSPPHKAPSAGRLRL